MDTYKKPDGANIGLIQSDFADTQLNEPKDTTNSQPDGKLKRMLRHFAMGDRLHRFDAERLGDHVLPTTVSGLQSTHKVYFNRKRIKIPNRFGAETSVCEYWLEGDQLRKAQLIVGLVQTPS